MFELVYGLTGLATAFYASWLDRYTYGRVLGEHRRWHDGPLVVMLVWPIFLPLYLAVLVRVWSSRRNAR